MAYRPGSYEPRRTDSYPPRRDSYGRDLDRDRAPSPRGRDSDRDRNYERPSPMGPPPHQRPTAPKIDTSMKRPRQDQPTSAASTSSPALSSPRPDSSSATHDMAKVFRELCRDLVKLGRIQHDLNGLERIVRIRETEHKASLPRHAEFPSVPELHKAMSTTELKERDKQKRRAEDYQQRIEKLSSQFLTHIQGLSESKDKNLKNIQKATSPQPNEAQEARLTGVQLQHKVLEERVKSVVSKLEDVTGEMKAEMEQHQAELKNVRENLRGKLDESSRGDDISALKRENEALRADLVSNKSEIADLRKLFEERVSRQDEELEKLCSARDDQAARIQALKTKVDTHEQTISELENLRSARDNQAAAIEALETKANVHEQTLLESERLRSARDEKLEKLGTARDDQAAKIQTLKTKVDVHEQTLSEFDADSLAQAADFFAYEKPEMVSRIASLKASLEGDVEKGQATTQKPQMVEQLASLKVSFQEEMKNDRVTTQKRMEHVIETVGGWVDELRKRCSAIELRTKNIESASTRQASAASVDDASLREAKEKLSKDITLLETTVQNSIQSVKEEFDQKCGTITVMVSTLDSQFNNLTTKELFEQIIGHMEKLLPNGETLRHVQQDLEKVIMKVQELANWQDCITNDSRTLKFHFEDQVRGPDAAFQRVSSDGVDVARKRRRIEKGSNDLYFENGHH